jgi:hypothetical protein
VVEACWGKCGGGRRGGGLLKIFKHDLAVDTWGCRGLVDCTRAPVGLSSEGEENTSNGNSTVPCLRVESGDVGKPENYVL